MFEAEINQIEECFLSQGARRMSDFFGRNHVYENGVPAYNTLWISGKYYYHVKACNDENGICITIEYNDALDEEFETFTSFTMPASKDEADKIINDIVYGISPSQLKILEKYLKFSDYPFEKDLKDCLVSSNYKIDGKEIQMNILTDIRSAKKIVSDVYKDIYEQKISDADDEPAESSYIGLMSFCALWDNEEYDKALELGNSLLKSFEKSSDKEKIKIIKIFIAGLLKDKGNFSESLEIALHLIDGKFGDIGKDDELYLLELIADNEYFMGSIEKAYEYSKKQCELARDLYEENDERCLWSMAKLCDYRCRSELSNEALLNAMEFYENVLEKYDEEDDISIYMLKVLSSAFKSIRNYDSALVADAKRYKICARKSGKDSIETLNAIIDIAKDICDIGHDYSDADELMKYVCDSTIKREGKETLRSIAVVSLHASILQQSGYLGMATGMEEECLKLAEKYHSDKPSFIILRKELLADAYISSSEVMPNGCIKKAVKLYKEAYDWKKKVFGEKDKETLLSYETLAMSYFHEGRKVKAIEMLSELFEQCTELFDENSIFTVQRLQNISFVMSDLGKDDVALAADQLRYERFKLLTGEYSLDTMHAMDDIIRSLRALGNNEEALKYAEKAARERSAILGEQHEESVLAQKMYEGLLDH